MTTYKPKNSPYYHFDFQFRGERYYGSTGCVSKRDADRYERDQRTEAATGKKEKPSITLDDGFGIFWQDRGTFEKAHKTTEYQIANLLRLLGGATLLHDLDDLSISGMIARRRGETVRTTFTGKAKRKKKRAEPRLVSNATVNREVELLKRMIRFLGGRYKLPEIDWTKHRLKEAAERVRELSPDEELALFDKLRAEDNDLADLVEFAELSGARKNAVVTLLWSKIDLRAGTAEVHTKGDVWHKFPLTQRMKLIIANRPKVGPFVFTYVCRRPAPQKPGQPRRLKGERYPFSAQGWDRRWRALLAEAGITNFRFHDLRHTAGTRITRASNLKVAQKLLGHTRIETTARYAHVTDDDILSAMENAEQSRNSPEQGAAGLPETRRNARVSGQ